MTKTPYYVYNDIIKQLAQPEYAIYSDVNTILKIYPTFAKLLIFRQSQSVRQIGYETDKIHTAQSTSINELQKIQYEESSIRRTRTKITDILLSNDFNGFATFTFNCLGCDSPCPSNPTNKIKGKKCTCPPETCRRFKPDIQKKRMSKWLDNQKTINGNFKYLIVPELHKDGKALHFHALLSGYTGKLKNSGKTINGRKAYTIKSYNLGFSSYVTIDNIDKVSSYVKKYITKDMPKFSGQHRYWCSKGLLRPITLQNPNIPQTFPDDHNKFYTVHDTPTATFQRLDGPPALFINYFKESNPCQKTIKTSSNPTQISLLAESYNSATQRKLTTTTGL